MSLLTQLIF